MDNNEVLSTLGDVDALDTMGYAPIEEQSRLMGAIMQLPPDQKKKATAKILAPRFGGANLDARDKAMQRLGGLPAEIREALAKKRLQLVDMEIYSTKLLTGSQIVRFFEDQDTMTPGLRNISNGKLVKDTFFLLTAVQFLTGVSSVTAPTGNPADAFFDVADVAAANGEFDFKANGNKYMLPKDSPFSMFTDVQYGGMKSAPKYTRVLDNPKWIEPQVAITFDARFAAAPATAGTWGRVKLIGVGVTAY